jgi:endoglycosylceramidase
MTTRRVSGWRAAGAIGALIIGSMVASCVGDFGASEESISEPTITSRRLTVEGERLYDSLGREVILRGFNVGGRAKMPPYLPFDVASGETTASAAHDFFGRIAALGANVVRLTFSWEAYEPTRGAYDAAYMMQYRTLLDAAYARGLFVIVDFHQDVFASPFYGDGFPLWTLGDIRHGEPRYDSSFPFWSLPALVAGTRVSDAFDRLWDNEDGIQDAMEAMWRSVASQLVSHPGVAAFEILNEPAGANRPQEEMDGTILPAFYTRMGRAIQEAAGSDVPVFWDSRINTTGIPDALVPPDFPNAVYAPHYYEPYIMIGFPVVLGNNIRNDIAATFSTRSSWNVPVFLGEYGVPSGNRAKAAFLDTLLDALDTHRGHGTMWDASASTMYWNNENFSVLNPNRTEVSWAGSVVRAYPLAIAGRITSFSWDATAQRFTMSVTAATDGVSEVYLPSRHLGTTPSITVTGDTTYTYVASSQKLLLRAPIGTSYDVTVTRTTSGTNR